MDSTIPNISGIDINSLQGHIPGQSNKTKPVTEVLDSNKLGFNCIKNYLKSQKLFESTDYKTTNIYKDLEIYEGLDNVDSSILNKINLTKTVFGYLKLITTLNSPSSQINELTNRQKEIKQMCLLLENNDKFNIEDSLQKLKEYQNDVIWMIKPKSIEEDSILNSVYFSGRLFSGLNNYEEPLNIYSYF